MSYKAKVFKVMIASPSDVATERNVIRDVILDWNASSRSRRSSSGELGRKVRPSEEPEDCGSCVL